MEHVDTLDNRWMDQWTLTTGLMIERVNLIAGIEVIEVDGVGFGRMGLTADALVNNWIDWIGWMIYGLHRLEKTWRYVNWWSVVTIVVDSITVVVSIVTCRDCNGHQSRHKRPHLSSNSNSFNKYSDVFWGLVCVCLCVCVCVCVIWRLADAAINCHLMDSLAIQVGRPVTFD